MTDLPRVCLDANAFIYALEGVRAESEISDQILVLFGLVRTGRCVGVTSELTLAEVLVGPELRDQTVLKRDYLDLLAPRQSIFDLRPITRDIPIESVADRARMHPDKPGPDQQKRNFLPDAIHVVTAVDAEASHHVGSDQRIRLPAGMERLDPRGSSLGAFSARVA